MTVDFKPTVLVVGPWKGSGGVVTFHRNLVLHSKLDEHWTFRKYNLSRIPHTVSKSAIYKSHPLSFLRSGKRHFLKNIGIIARNFSLFSWILRDVDLIQLQSSDDYAFWEASIFLLMAKAQNKPVSMRFGGSFNVFYDDSSPQTQKIIRYLLSLPDVIIVQSEMWKAFFSTIADQNRIHIMPNAVRYPPPLPKRELKTTGLRALFNCGNEAVRKGVETILEIAPRFKDRVKFVFVAVKDSLRQDIIERGLAPYIEMHGDVPREKMQAQMYPEADIFLLPSYFEGFPNMMLEAMSAGIPIITSPAGAIPEVITPGVHGFINEASDSEGLARDLLFLCDNPQKRHEMGLAGYNLILEKYILEDVFSRFNTIWKSIL